MRTQGYVVGLAAFAALMTGGISAGLYLTQGAVELPPGEVSFADDSPVWVVVGNTGPDTPTSRQVREAAARACEARGGCTGVLLVGEATTGGVVRADDRALPDQIGSWTEIAPVYLAFSRTELHDRRLGAAVAWARDEPDVHAPSSAWSGDAWGLDVIAIDDPEARADWIAETRRMATGRWPIALSPHADQSLCGSFELVFHATHERSWVRDCGTTWIGVGTGSAQGFMSDADLDSPSLFRDPEPGFAIVERRGEPLHIALYGLGLKPDFEAILTHGGLTSLPDGTVLLTRE